MLLAIDAGNTNIVFAIFDGDRLVGSWRTATETKRTADEYAVWLTQLMGLKDLKPRDITACVFSSVVPELGFEVTDLIQRYFNVTPLIVGTSIELGIKVKLDRPEEVGADRLVNAVGALSRYKPPMIIVDFGTATTFDVVDESGDYRGGVIAPGINLSLQALYMAAAKLPRVAIRRTEKVIGTGTITAMQSGIFWGYIGLIDGLVRRIIDEMGQPMRVIATGGLAPLFSQSAEAIEIVDQDLTLSGLRLIYSKNSAL